MFVYHSPIFPDFVRGSTFYSESSVEAIVFLVAVFLLMTMVGLWKFHQYIKKKDNGNIPSISRELNLQASRGISRNAYYVLEIRRI